MARLLLSSAILIALCAGTPLLAQPNLDVVRPEGAGRTVRVFDFEERAENPDEVPRLWFRDQDNPTGTRRPGYPPWNAAALSYTTEGGAAFAGEGSLMLPTRGGSTSLTLGPGAIPVFDNADYMVSARVRTAELRHAGVSLVARFLDRAGKPIAASERRTAPTRTDGSWSEVGLELPGKYEGAAWIQLELALVQPAEQGPATGPHETRGQDFAGAGWFDDVTVLQLPRVELTSNALSNVVAAPERPTLRLLVRDLTGERLTLVTEVLDIDGVVVDRDERAAGAGMTRTEWTPRLTRLGWYRVRLLVRAGERLVGAAATDVLWVPARAEPGKGHERFALVFDDLPAEMRGMVVQVAARAGVGGVTFPVWTPGLTPENAAAEARALQPMVSDLAADFQTVTMSLTRMPVPLASRLHRPETDVWAAFAADAREWQPYAVQFFDLFGQRAARWQVGGFAAPTPTHAELAALRSRLDPLLPSPTLAVPVRIEDRAAPLEGVCWLALVGFDADPVGVGIATRGWREAMGGREFTGVFERGPSEYAAPAASCAMLARQVLEFWGGVCADDGTLPAGVSAALRGAWRWDEARRPTLMPGPELGAWRTLADMLRDRRVIGEFPVTEGVRCLILSAGTGGAVLAAWNESASAEAAVLDAYLGDGAVRVVDLFGNATETTASEHGTTRVVLGAAPVFITGVDADLLRVVASLRMDNPTLECTNEDQERKLILTNPGEGTIAGRITVVEPGGFARGERDRSWRISPRTMPFTLAPGETAHLPLLIGFSPVEEAGPREFVFRLELNEGIIAPPIDVRRAVELGLRDLQLELTAVRRGEQVIVEVAVSNSGAMARELGLTAFAPGQPRAKASVSRLDPGGRAVKRFQFENAPGLVGQRIVLRVEDPESGQRISKSVVVR